MSVQNSTDGHKYASPSLAPRPVRDSQSQMAEVVLPNDANPLGNLLGGRLMHFIDIAGAIAAHRTRTAMWSRHPWTTLISACL
ncbi:MAG TPA: hypothetical protein VN223_02480 [Candidatus Elarobacter sp.]|nr:hypothetical protein [Candidatus Elarobacter sp.]